MISRIALALAAVTAIAPAFAQQYPVKPIRIIVPFTAGEPTDILARIVNLPEVRSRTVDLGAEPIANSPAAFDAFQKAEMVRWAKVIRDSGAKAE